MNQTTDKDKERTDEQKIGNEDEGDCLSMQEKLLNERQDDGEGWTIDDRRKDDRQTEHDEGPP